MATQVVMPKLSPTMEEGQLARWLKKEGDKVSMGEPLAEIDTDKATMEMQALSNGVLRKILINEGESAPLGQPIAIIGEPDEDISELLKTASAPKPEKAAEAPQSQPESDAAPAAEEQPQEVETPEPTHSISGDGQKPRTDGRVLISPIAARMASEAGIDFKTVQGSGPGGRIVKRDVESAISDQKNPAVTKGAVGRISIPRPARAGVVYGPSAYRDEPVSEMRRTIAKRLVTSLGPVPHFFLTMEIDMERAADHAPFDQRTLSGSETQY